MNLRRLVLFQTTIIQRPLPEPVSSLMGKTMNRIFCLTEAVFGPVRASFDYLTLFAEKTVLSVLKLRFTSSEQMFNINATF